MKLRNLIFSNIALIFLIGSFSYSQFTASVNRNRIAMGEQIEITFTFEGSGKNFQPPPFNDFLVLSGPNQSTSMQFINGNVSQSISYAYIIQPRAEGKFTIGPAQIDSDGKQYKTSSISIEVGKSTQQPQTQKPQQSSEEASIMQQIGENLFLKVSVDKSNVYQGEQLTATYKLYTRVNIVNYGISKVPALTGFWSQEIDLPQNPQFTNEVLNGIQYKVAPLKKSTLFPQRSGTLELDPLEAEFVVQVQTRRRSGDIFDQFFNDPFFGNVRNVNYKTKSSTLKINVKPLPENAPPGFGGAVGKFTMESWLDKPETKTNEPVTLKIKITGRGNIKLIDPIKINIPPDLESYEPKISDNIPQGSGVISGNRTFEFLLVPRRAGTQKIPPFTFSYFDTEKKDYVSFKSPEFLINVTKGKEIVSAPVAGLSKEEIKLLGEDIRFIKSGSVSFKKRGDNFFGSLLFFILSAAPIFVFFGFIYFYKKYEQNLGDVVRLKSKRATKIAKQRLKSAKQLLDEKKKESFYEEISRALWGYVSDRLGIQLSELSKDSVTDKLTSRKVSEETIGKLLASLDQCEFARFAPSTDSVEMDKMYTSSVDLITDIEEEIR